MPRRPDGEPVIYLCGNSLGLQPTAARALVEQELDDWARLGVEAHFHGATPWYSYHEVFRETGARLVGARPGEVVMMNSLTVNLHLLLASFYRPDGERRRILMEAPAFPSDTYAVHSHLRARGIDPDDCLRTVGPRDDEQVVRTEDIEAALEHHGHEVALVLIGGVNFLTGQAFDMARITAAAHDRGCLVGFDLAHAAGNLELQLHDWGVDFAAWCSYKYLNGGPGAIGGCFIHERHARDVARPRFGGWWGNDPETRFRMHLETEFVPKADADGWQLSNPPILAMAPLRASLAIFDEVGMAALRAKSIRLTGYLRSLLEAAPERAYEIITPGAPEAHGCQLSIVVRDRPRERFEALQAAGVVCDFRPPDVIRAAPVPLYNSFLDAWSFARILAGSAHD
ncbi:MAG: kynureninase, partial [Planctomycetota bacterium]|jgi:kynureninase